MHDNGVLLAQLKGIVGRPYVLTGSARTGAFATGIRFGGGPAYAVVRPGCLVELWRVLSACVAADKIVIVQAANTGLTGGSTPDGNDYDREIVIINTLRIGAVYPINEGRQVICLPGATLSGLESVLRPFGRAPHSVIGSSCIGASVLGGICNNSGGALIQRGPAYTEMALFATVDKVGTLRLVNHLGIDLGDDPETILGCLDRRTFTQANVESTTGRAGSDQAYVRHVRNVDAETPARFNADARRLFEASGSAGRIVVFAVRLDTFEQEKHTSVFYIGTNDTSELESIRRYILATFKSLPVSGEYIHRDAFNLAEKYGKDTFLAVRYLGASRMPALFALKTRVDALTSRWRILPNLSDRLMQAIGGIFPSHLPRRMKQFRDQFEHHLLLKMSGSGVDEARAYLDSLFPSSRGACFECIEHEGDKAFLHRFAVAGAAIRYRALHGGLVEDIISLDIALRRDERDWFERLPSDLRAPVIHALYYGHFFCHVFHQDYIVAKGHDVRTLEHRMLKQLDARGAEYPAEHNVGHLYKAKPGLADHYTALDPCNVFNPGIGQTSKLRRWL